MTAQTRILMLSGLALAFIGLRWYKPREAINRLNRTLPQFHRDRLAGLHRFAHWELALQWLGFGLVVLAFWRSCSGV